MVELAALDRTQVALAGGKAANLGELMRIDGVRVPDGWCVTTDAFRRAIAGTPAIGELVDRLGAVSPDDGARLRELADEVRSAIEQAELPADLREAITTAVTRSGDGAAFAVRSSATAEDLPTASFAGQQDTFLNVVGAAGVVEHVRRCWASLFSDRAVSYRNQHGIDHRTVQMAVVVQRLVDPQAAGVLFTADPVTSNRTICTVEAGYGLGEALVDGRVEADSYQVRNDRIVAAHVGSKALAVRPSAGGGTHDEPIDPSRRSRPALSDDQVLDLARLGRRIEAHFGHPQDIEWCVVDGEPVILQSRPITTLFPVPDEDDGEPHVYVSVGHQQMMTDPMQQLGISVWLMTAARPMHVAGGRLFVDVAAGLASPASRDALLGALGTSDPLIGDALQTVVDRADTLPVLPEGGPSAAVGPAGAVGPGDEPGSDAPEPGVVRELIERSAASIARLRDTIESAAGAEVFDVIVDDIAELRQFIFGPESRRAVMAGIDASAWLNEHLETWLGEPQVADTLTQSVPHNVTSQMGLALLDVADAIRPLTDVVAFLRTVDTERPDLLEALADVAGGPAAVAAIRAFLDDYGMRCVGEIDITRPRWRDRPGTLVPTILGNVDRFEPGAGARRFEQGRQEALAKEQEVVARLRALAEEDPGPEHSIEEWRAEVDRRVDETRRTIERLRNFIGYREFPKYDMVSRYAIYRRALMAEAAQLVREGIIGADEDIFHLTFEELRDAVRTRRVDRDLIEARRAAFETYGALTPPRVLTSDGEVVAGVYRRDGVPDGALVGLAVSAGTVEGRARVLHDISDADLEAGDILVTSFTDPSWSPLFVAITALVTEVGGLMTHGAVVAREYGLPAVVGVEHATTLIRDGQRIRVHGTDGYVELLEE